MVSSRMPKILVGACCRSQTVSLHLLLVEINEHSPDRMGVDIPSILILLNIEHVLIELANYCIIPHNHLGARPPTTFC